MFGYNGQMIDKEFKGEGNHIDFKFRGYDPRLGRFFSVDPLFKEYPWNTSFAFSENDVIRFVDLEGLEKGTRPAYTDYANMRVIEAKDNNRLIDQNAIILKAITPIPKKWESSEKGVWKFFNELDAKNQNYQGDKGFKKLGQDMSEKVAPVVKGTGVILTAGGAPEIGIPVYKAGGYIEDTGNAIEIGMDLKEGNTKNAAVNIVGNTIGKLAGQSVDVLPIDDEIRKFAIDVTVEKTSEEIIDIGKAIYKENLQTSEKDKKNDD